MHVTYEHYLKKPSYLPPFLLHMSTWNDFETLLKAEFLEIHSEYNKLKENLTEDTRKDFDGLLRYATANNNSSSFTEPTVDTDITTESELELESIINTLLDLVDSDTNSFVTFAPEYSNFPVLLKNAHKIPSPRLVSLCEKYWKCRYPSVKESFIIPVAIHIFGNEKVLIDSDELKMEMKMKLKGLLTRRLLKGKLVPFRQSVTLAKMFQIQPDQIDYFDQNLSSLKDLLYNHEESHLELLAVLKQSGCHCD